MTSPLPAPYRRTIEGTLDDLDGTFRGARRTPFLPQALSDALSGGIGEEFLVLTAKPGAGKTDLVLNAALGLSLSRKVLISSHEISREACVRRMLPCATKLTGGIALTTDQIASHDSLNPDQIEALTRAKDVARKMFANIVIVDDGDMTGEGAHSVEALADAIAAIAIEDGRAPAVIVDYAQLLDTTSAVFSTTDALDRISRTLCSVAHSLHTPVITVSNLAKNGSIRGSIQFDFDADVRLHLETGDDLPDGSREARVAVEKFRDGRANQTVVMTYWPMYHCFN